MEASRMLRNREELNRLDILMKMLVMDRQVLFSLPLFYLFFPFFFFISSSSVINIIIAAFCH